MNGSEASDRKDRFFVLTPSDLSKQALRGLVEEFVSRDGTDYGREEKTLEQKVDAVLRQIDADEVSIVFDRDEEKGNLVKTADLESELG